MSVMYLDDIIVFNKFREEDKRNLLQLLNTLKKQQLVAKPFNSKFFRMELLSLGHIITATGIKSYPANLKAITNMPPNDASEVRTFFSMIASIRKFIPSCGELLAPLHRDS